MKTIQNDGYKANGLLVNSDLCLSPFNTPINPDPCLFTINDYNSVITDNLHQVAQDKNIDDLPKQVITQELSFSLGDALGRLRASFWIDKNTPLSKAEVVASYLTWLKKRCLLFFDDGNYITVGYGSKRGNKAYADRVNEHFRDYEFFNPMDFFDPKAKSHDVKTTKMLYFTLTNKGKCDVRTAWLKLGKTYNRFLSNLKKQYGKIYQVRCFEAYKNGYPHIHAVIYFVEHDFKIAYQDNNNVFRVHGYNKFRKYWHSFIDVQACYDTNVMYYLSKHNVKFCEQITANSELKHIQTLAYCWLYRKRSFSISKGFTNKILRLDTQGCITQTPLHEVSFIGICFVREHDSIELQEGWWHKFRKNDLPKWLIPLIRRAEDWSKIRQEQQKSGVVLGGSLFRSRDMLNGGD